jgi:hypothetical protein
LEVGLLGVRRSGGRRADDRVFAAVEDEERARPSWCRGQAGEAPSVASSRLPARGTKVVVVVADVGGGKTH